MCEFSFVFAFAPSWFREELIWKWLTSASKGFFVLLNIASSVAKLETTNFRQETYFFRFGDFTLLFQKYCFFYELFVSDSGTNRPVLKWLRLTFWTFNTSDMPLKRKQYNRFTVGQYTKARKSLQEEFAREKASLSQLSKEVKTLQRKVQRLDDKVNKLRMTTFCLKWN